uniref:AlNc14C4G576 protein n=1 Tax=Albugo laibachii Nc14 TaxID=890382 RepID=F0W0D3_9STRA|nr:AlNc14C4G576 [Albugo laibachii Nc14]|eukprot:CCA14505.1 AlNc14C4G576 [Albugo laibachii Nc14]
MAPTFDPNSFTNVLRSEPTAKIDMPSVSMQSNSESTKSTPPVVCLFQTSTSAQCRKCIRQRCDLAYFGEFLVHSPLNYQNFILYVISTTRDVQVIVESCFTSSACSGHAIQIPSENCERLVLGGPMRDYPMGKDAQLYTSSTSAHYLRIQEHMGTTFLEPKCIGVPTASFPGVLRVMKCLAKVSEGLLVLLSRKYEVASDAMQFLSVLIPTNSPSLDFEFCHQGITHPDVRFCNMLIAEYFDISSLPDEITV